MADYEVVNNTITLTVPTQGSVPVISIYYYYYYYYYYNYTHCSSDFHLGLDRVDASLCAERLQLEPDLDRLQGRCYVCWLRRD